MSDLTLHCVSFPELNNAQLYALLQLRSAVFVVEQNCAFQDMDDYDQQAWHILGDLDGKLVCYARLLAPGDKHEGASIGRVVSHQSIRRDGHGKALMAYCVDKCRQYWPDATVVISAQQYLEAFYRGFGFHPIRGPYMEDGIPHLEMHLPAPGVT